MRTPSDNIVLVGMRASGKSTLGARLAERLGRPFVDLDEELARRAGRPAERVLADDGEAAFRSLEAEVLRRAAERRGHVIATGGGAVLHGPEFEALARVSVVAYLELSAAELAARSARRRKTPLTDLPLREEVERLLAERGPLYRRVADITIPVDAADPILTLLDRLSSGPTDEA